MNVLHLISSAGMYGAEAVVSALCRDLEQMGCSVHIGLFENAHCAPSDVHEQLRSRGLSVIRIPCRGRMNYGAIAHIRHALRSLDIDVLHSHGYKADIYGYLAASRQRLPLVATCHLWTSQTAAIRAYEFLDSWFLRGFDAVVAVSEPIAKQTERAGVARHKIQTIDNGIDISRYQSASPSLSPEIRGNAKLLIGSAGRLVAQKGMDYLLKAARRVLDESPETVFVVVGDGPDRSKLDALARDLGISGSVVFTGRRDDMPGVYASLDVFVLASLDEGMPMAVLEAMAAGCPVVATSVGAVSKVIHPEHSGMLVEPANVEQLAGALTKLIRDPQLRRQLATAGQTSVCESFSSRAMSRRYLQVYETLLKNRRPGFETVSHPELGA